MAYDVEIKPASKNGYFTPAESRAYYAAGYARNGITCHWWGNPGEVGDHDATVQYILGTAAAGKMSVNFVVSDQKITQLVDADNVAWASNAGNPTTIGIEFQPTLSDEGYKRGGWLISELEKRYNKTLILYKHSDWFPTACPGTIDLSRLRREADAFKQGVADTMTIPDQDNYYGRYGVDLANKLRGRTLSRLEFQKSIVGQTDLRAIEILSDDPEAQTIQKAQELGVLATKDNWQGQIYSLQDAVKQRDAIVTDLKAQLQAGMSTKAELQQALDRIAKLTADYTAVQQQNDDLIKDKEESQKVGNAFVQWIGSLFKSK